MDETKKTETNETTENAEETVSKALYEEMKAALEAQISAERERADRERVEFAAAIKSALHGDSVEPEKSYMEKLVDEINEERKNNKKGR